MACVHSLNCKIPFAMDRSRKNEIYYAQSSGMKKNYNAENWSEESLPSQWYNVSIRLVIFRRCCCWKVNMILYNLPWMQLNTETENTCKIHSMLPKPKPNISFKIEYLNVMFSFWNNIISYNFKDGSLFSNSNVNKFIKHAINSKCFSFEMEISIHQHLFSSIATSHCNKENWLLNWQLHGSYFAIYWCTFVQCSFFYSRHQ